MVASLVGCQISVLDQCLHRGGIEEFTIEANARIPSDSVRNDETATEMPAHTATRIEHIEIDLTARVDPADASRAERCLEVYDQGCIVGQSFTEGISYTPTTSLEITE